MVSISNQIFLGVLHLQFLSMKLAAVNPRIDFNLDNFFAKEVNEQVANCFKVWFLRDDKM